MGLRGPAPKPTRLKLLAGTYRPDRVAPGEPRPLAAIPPRPRGLSAEGRRHWDRLARQLRPLQVVTLADGAALELLAEALGEWERASALVAKEGAVYRATTKSGTVLLAHPAAKQAADAWRRAQRMLAEFGLSPSSRTRVSAIPPGSETGNRFGQVDLPEQPRRRRRAL